MLKMMERTVNKRNSIDFSISLLYKLVKLTREKIK